VVSGYGWGYQTNNLNAETHNDHQQKHYGIDRACRKGRRRGFGARLAGPVSNEALASRPMTTSAPHPTAIHSLTDILVCKRRSSLCSVLLNLQLPQSYPGFLWGTSPRGYVSCNIHDEMSRTFAKPSRLRISLRYSGSFPRPNQRRRFGVPPRKLCSGQGFVATRTRGARRFMRLKKRINPNGAAEVFSRPFARLS
jgi:hypothetical protein